MTTLNVFNCIRAATRRTEPFHSRFLADALCSSASEDRSLFEAFWRLAAPEGWQPPDTPDVRSEHGTGEGRRIDICILDHARARKRVLGIEVKTWSPSARPNQLQNYLRGLTERHEGAEVAIAYLTPFNRRRAGKAADRIGPIREFEEFARTVKHARHVSWLEVAEIEWDGRDIWKQHQWYVRYVIASPSKLVDDPLPYQSFHDFFGTEAAGRFWEALVEIGVHPSESGARIDLTNLEVDAEVLVRAFEILIQDGENVDCRQQSDQFEDALRERFMTSEHHEFHEAVFGLSRRFGGVWVSGKRDYAIRVGHKGYPGGVSLVRSRGTSGLETGRPRPAREL